MSGRPAGLSGAGHRQTGICPSRPARPTKLISSRDRPRDPLCADRRGIADTLELAWELLAGFPRHELKRIRPRFRDSRR